MCKLFILDEDTWYHIIVCKKHLRNNYRKNLNINVQWMQFPNLNTENNPRQVDMPLKSISELNEKMSYFSLAKLTDKLLGSSLAFLQIEPQCEKLKILNF